jgi:hypothetical protein
VIKLYCTIWDILARNLCFHRNLLGASADILQLFFSYLFYYWVIINESVSLGCFHKLNYYLRPKYLILRISKFYSERGFDIWYPIFDLIIRYTVFDVLFLETREWRHTAHSNTAYAGRERRQHTVQSTVKQSLMLRLCSY